MVSVYLYLNFSRYVTLGSHTAPHRPFVYCEPAQDFLVHHHKCLIGPALVHRHELLFQVMSIHGPTGSPEVEVEVPVCSSQISHHRP